MKYLFLNHKMNLTKEEFLNYQEELLKLDTNDIELVVFPSSTYLSLINGDNFKIGSQDVCEYDDGSYTGEISANQLTSIGCSYCLVGHSERRNIYNETNKEILLKINNLQHVGITPVLCVGEKNRDIRYSVLMEQLDILEGCNLDNLVIAYEPVYSIGTGVVLDNDTIEEAILWIKEYVISVYDKDIPVLYGGSVNDTNISTLNKVPGVDGFLVGSASLSIDKVKTMVEVISSGKIME